jgi:Ca2+-binding RTX toxin-like protein
MFFSVLDKSGAILQPATSLGAHLSFDTAPNSFGQNVFHVGSNGNGGYTFLMSEFINGFVDDSVFTPFTEHRISINVTPKGKVSDPVEVAQGTMTYELSDTTTLSNGNVALLFSDSITRIANLQILEGDGSIISTHVINGTFDNVGIFAQGTEGLEVLQVGTRILTLYRNPATETLYGQFFKLDGTESGTGEFTISEAGHTDASFAAVWQDGVVDATVLADERVAVVWADGKTGSDGTEVWLTILNADGSVSVAESRANINHLTGEQFHPRVHALEDGGFIVTFDQNFAFAASPRGYAQLFDATGNPVGDLLELHAGVAGNGGTGYGYIYPDGTGFMIDWYGNVQQISNGGGTGGGPIIGTGGKDNLDGTNGDDIMDGKGGADTLKGLDGKDKIKGGGGNDIIKGGDGNDKLFGGSGNDDLDGGNGRDNLRGGGGKDTLDGGKSNDTLKGDGGADTFVFAKGYGKDKITDFADDVDRIALDDALWGGGLTLQKMLNQFAAVVDGDIVLDFGKHELTIEGLTDISALKNDIDIV